MRVICPGCGATFKRSGLAHHLRQSQDPNCQLPHVHRQSDDNLGVQATGMSDDEPPTPDARENEPQLPQEQSSLGIDPAGDIFGDYNSYTAEDFGVDDGDEQDIGEPLEYEEDPGSLADTQEEDETAEYEALLAEEEHRLEPERPIQGRGIPDQGPTQDVVPSHRPFRLRGGFDEPLATRPEIVRFKPGNSRAVHESQHNGNQGYHRSLRDADNPNPYRPFASKLDWEIGRWAKMRGPGSTALTELLSLEGVSFLSVRKTN
jgi:hypothetical protein